MALFGCRLLMMIFFHFIKRVGFFKKMRLTINVNEDENLPKENGQNGMVEQEKKAKSLFCSLTER